MKKSRHLLSSSRNSLYQYQNNSSVVKSALIYINLFADLILNTVFEPPNDVLSSILLLFCLQILVLIFNLVLFYMMFLKLWFFQTGLFGSFLRKFRLFCIVVALNLVLFVIVRFYRVLAVVNYVPRSFIWEQPAYFPLYIIQRIVMAVYFATMLRTCYRLGDPQLYTENQNEINRVFSRRT